MEVKTHRAIGTAAAVILYLLGLVTGLVLSGWFGWAGAEALVLVPRTGDVTLTTLRCPLILGLHETGTVSATFNNPTAETINPTIMTQISHGSIPQEEDTVLELAPGQVQSVQWKVGAADKVFDVLILVNVYETSQRNTSSGQTSCGILFIPSGNISGKGLLILMDGAAFIGLIAGLILWRRARSSLRGLQGGVTSAMTALAVIVILSLLLMLLSWWLATGIGFLISVMLIGIILSQYILFPGVAERPRR